MHGKSSSYHKFETIPGKIDWHGIRDGYPPVWISTSLPFPDAFFVEAENVNDNKWKAVVAIFAVRPRSSICLHAYVHSPNISSKSQGSTGGTAGQESVVQPSRGS
jgi:hypothetical protein